MPSTSEYLKAYGGWGSAVFGGFLIGSGIVFQIMIRLTVEHFGIGLGDLTSYSDLHILSLAFLVLGIILCGAGLFMNHSLLGTDSS